MISDDIITFVDRTLFDELAALKGEDTELSTIECEVVSDSQVRFREEVMSLSKSANIVIEELGSDWGGAIAGPMFWCYHADTLYDLRLQEEQ